MTSFQADSELESDIVDGTEPETPERLDLTVTVTSPTACQRHVTVQVPRGDIERYYGDAISKMVPSANVPGFRPGRAPRKLVESHYRKELKDQIKSTILYDCLTQISEDEKFATISDPEFDIESVVLPDEGPMTFEFDLEVRPEFEVPNWKGLSLERPVREFSELDVDQAIAEAMDHYIEFEPTKAPVTKGDTLLVNFEFWHNGECIARRENEAVAVRSSVTFHDGTLFNFDPLVLGASTGDVREGTVEITEDCAREELRGESVQVRIEIQEVSRKSANELASEHLKPFGAKSMDELRGLVRDTLERRLAYHQNQKIRQQITQLLADASNWELPPNLLRRQTDRELERSIMELRSGGFSESEIRAHTNLLRQNSMQTTATAIRQHFILEKIAEEEEIDASEADFDWEIEQMALQSNESPRSIRARIEKRGQIDILRNQIVERKVMDRIRSHAKFKDVSYELPRPTASAIDFAIGGESADAIPLAKHRSEQQELPRHLDRT